jgi:hypothetical protein
MSARTPSRYCAKLYAVAQSALAVEPAKHRDLLVVWADRDAWEWDEQMIGRNRTDD